MGSRTQLQTYHEWDYHPEQASESPLSGVRSAADLVDYVFPDLTDPGRYVGLSDQIQSWHAQGLAVAGSPPHLGGELFETAFRLRGFQNFLKDLLKRKSLVHYILDQVAAMAVHNALILAKAGVDILLLDDDVAMPDQLIMSPDTWREFFRPRWIDIIRIAREASPDLLIFYHCDGNFTQIVPELADIGVNVINPIQPDCMEASAIKKAFGNRLALWGTVGTAWQWDFGTPDQIRAEVRHRIETLGPEGLLLSPAYDLDFTPFENIAAFIEAVEEYGHLE
jgi:uroporphyrinogen decarboxylase